MLDGRQALPIPEIARIQHGHITVREIKRQLPDEVWNAYLKFGFVRNPFDRYVSTCFFLNRYDPRFSAHADRFLRTALSDVQFRQRVLVRPQHLQLEDETGRIALDVVGRYERLQESFDDICARIGISAIDLKVRNASSHRRFVDYYDDELIATVREFYAQDLAAFGYEFADNQADKSGAL